MFLTVLDVPHRNRRSAMGNTPDHSRWTPEFEEASKKFHQSGLQSLKKLYVSLAAQSRSNGKFVSASAFQAYFGIHGALGNRLFDIVTQMRKDQAMYYEDLVIAKAKYEKGDPSEIEDFDFQLMDLTGDGKVQRTEVEAVIISILATVLGPSDAVVDAGLPEYILRAFLNAADFSLQPEREKEEECITKEDFHKWLERIPSIKKFLGSLLKAPHAEEVIVGRQVPSLLIPEGIDCSTLLRKEYAWHIAGPLQLQETQEWVLLYHSSVNGLSFNTFMGHISAARGPSILVVKDKQGNIFGGYASQPWERHSEFYGDMKSFLFTLHPRLSIYRCSGKNNNIQWCAANFVSESLPNGIGFGGQIHHFGLFMSSSFERGHSRPSITFSSPVLSSAAEFEPDTIECWAVVVDSDGDNQSGGEKLKGTILERFKEDRQMLNMVGIANASNE
ncbi:hypothetical protein R1flu_020542 [Riccia fluitans]|uniref:TLDc domain-containing protein n=1 Tax=Riccia fluitans TaxID=41844 RepID=A0ABD1ZQJ5_9MARC